MNINDFTNHPEEYPFTAHNKKTGEEVAYGGKFIGTEKIYSVIEPSTGSIFTYDQQDFSHYFNAAA